MDMQNLHVHGTTSQVIILILVNFNFKSLFQTKGLWVRGTKITVFVIVRNGFQEMNILRHQKM